MKSTKTILRSLFGFSLVWAVICLLSRSKVFTSDASGLPHYSRSTPLLRPRSAGTIPNILHFTLLKDNGYPVVHFSFESFLSMYSAIHHMQPSSVYIHTDHTQEELDKAASSGSKWTRKMFEAFPQIIFNQVTAPTEVNGLEVENVEAKSDFIRWEQLFEKGGTYIDWDVLTLRDIRPLRQSGFRAVVGRHWGGKVNSGCMMVAQGSALAYLMKREQYNVFDNGWETHAVNLLTDVAERLVRTPFEVLIMDESAMAPFGWDPEPMDELFAPHFGEYSKSDLDVDGKDEPMALWNGRARDKDWEVNFGATYFLHAFKARIYEPEDFHGVSVKYIMRRDSNYALAAWPMIQVGIAEGLFSEDDDSI